MLEQQASHGYNDSIGGVALHYSQEELTGLGLSVARGDADITEVVAWIESHIV